MNKSCFITKYLKIFFSNIFNFYSVIRSADNQVKKTGIVAICSVFVSANTYALNTMFIFPIELPAFLIASHF